MALFPNSRDLLPAHGMTVPARGPPVYVPASDKKETCSDTNFSSPPAGIEHGTSSARGQCANHRATALPCFRALGVSRYIFCTISGQIVSAVLKPTTSGFKISSNLF